VGEAAVDLAPIDAANLLAGQAVAYATAYLDGRQDAEQLLANALRLEPDLFAARDPATNGILDPVRLLTIAMLHTASVQDEARQDRWQHVMGALVELVRSESRVLRDAKRAAEEGR
jgi:hypothetical protein